METIAPQRIVIFNVFGHLNGGDAMLLETTVDLINETNPNATLAGIAFDPASERTWMPMLEWHERPGNKTSLSIVGKLRQLISTAVLIAMCGSRRLFPLRWLLPADQRRSLELLSASDLAISSPGGYLEDSNHAYLLNLLQMRLARKLSRRIVLAPQSIGPIRSNWGKKIARLVLADVDCIFVREPWSMNFTEALLGNGEGGRNATVRRAGDLAFWFKPKHEENLQKQMWELGVDPNKKILGMTMVNWNFPGHPDPLQAKALYVEAVCELIDYVNTLGTHQVVIFNQVDSDLVLTRQVAQRKPNLVLDLGSRSSSLLAAMIATSDIFIGTRFHSCIFALLGGVPTAAISYLPKTTGIMQDLRQSSFVVDINSVTGDDLKHYFIELTTNRTMLAAAVQSAVGMYKQEQGSFISFLEAEGR